LRDAPGAAFSLAAAARPPAALAIAEIVLNTENTLITFTV
jgi:hypothetical protein